MKKLFYLFFFILFSNLAYADGYWLELESSWQKNDTVMIKIRYGGVNEKNERYIKTGNDLNKMKDFIVTVVDSRGIKTNLSIQQKKDFWVGYFIPKKDGIYNIYANDNNLPVVERENYKQNIKPTQYLQTKFIIGCNNENINVENKFSYLNLNIDTINNKAFISAYIDGEKVKKGTKLRVFLPNNNDVELLTDEIGNAQIELILKGQYIVRLDKNIPVYGQLNGKEYFSERHRSDYSFVVK